MLIMLDNNYILLRSRYIIQNLDKIHYLSITSKKSHINKRGKEKKITKLSLWIILRLYFNLNLKLN